MDIHRCRFVDYTPHTITSLSFSSPPANKPSSLRLAVGRSNGDIEIWNPRWSWVHETTLKGGRDRAIEGLAWSNADELNPRLFSIGGSTSITEWDLKTGKIKLNYPCNAGIIWSVAASSDGTKLAAGCDNGTVVIVDIAGGQGVMSLSKILQRVTARILNVAWKNGPDSAQVIGGCSDARIRIWSTGATGKLLATMRVDKSIQREDTLVWSVMVLNNGKQLVSGDSTGSVKIWDISSSQYSLLQTFKSHEADVLCLCSNLTGDSVFSAGVDRKIVNYQIVDRKLKRWATVSSRLLHAHDIRALASYESVKGSSNFLVSGGVERSLVVNSLKEFRDGLFRKIPITRLRPCVAVYPLPRLVISWSDQVVKIWHVEKDPFPAQDSWNVTTGHRLVSKLSLNSEENITYAALSASGRFLAVSTLEDTKLFRLSQLQGDRMILKVQKIKTLSKGATISIFSETITDSVTSIHLILASPESEIFILKIDDDIASIEQRSKKLEARHKSRVNSEEQFSFLHNISLMTISSTAKYLAVTRLSGLIDIFDLTTSKHLGSLPRFSTAPPTAVKFSQKNTLLVATADIKLLEFDIAENALTKWSRQNTDLIPPELASSVDKCCGIYYDNTSPNRIWLWGATWLCFVDLEVNIATERVPKRRREKLGLSEDDTFESQTKQELKSILKMTERLKDQSASPVLDDDGESIGQRGFWMTHKYRPILLADTFGDGEMVVIERPPFDLPMPPAFWSNHKIRM